MSWLARPGGVSPKRWVAVIAVVAALSGCGSQAGGEKALAVGRRVQSSNLEAQGPVSLRLEMVEIVFREDLPGAPHARRVAVVLDFVDWRAQVSGFLEWGPVAGTPVLYTVSGQAQRLAGKVTRFNLTGYYLATPPGAIRDEAVKHPHVLAFWMVVDEAIGEATLGLQ